MDLSRNLLQFAAVQFILLGVQITTNDGKRGSAQKPGARRRDIEAEVQAAGQERLTKRRRSRRTEDPLSTGDHHRHAAAQLYNLI